MKISAKLSVLSVIIGMTMLVHSPLYANDAVKIYKYSLSDGADICFKKIKEKLGEETKVSTISSFFASGSEIDPRSANRPQGVMTTCTVSYQNPENSKRLLSMSMDTRTGEFKKPLQVEIRVSGDSSKFDLNNYLIALDKVNLSPLPAFMESQEKNLSAHYSKFAWTGVRLSSPGTFSNKHQLRVDVAGRLAVNDIKESGYAEFSVDGKKVIKNRLIK
ncbi:hypothetical protein [Serratia oryzae]|uniref:hypothetical protein n=1 Tax=Serratia oryzae TaxID=2034155 RepID=UPI0012F159C2|nr:hypothetical protein [Serratia oryzae]VXD00799.1 conserved hypothetical protein [Enterobacterales bacterium 8AC]